MVEIPNVGTKAPDFSVLNQNGENINLKDLNGKWVVMYFYPKDDTPGCTIEANEFTSLSKNFEKENTIIFGISPDDEKSHCKFIEKYKLNIDLLADTEKKLVTEYGVWKEKSMYGRTYMGVTRTTFLIDDKGDVAEVWTNVKAKGHAEIVLNRLVEIKQ
ncbi:MAG: peroxiredoxin [Marine Group III euryarchaeote CG-Bathy1]|uniref:thioredoxin-dependent peroxiredoxin n=1 Tax=Marine Group III euryarchaeote CG-Bathy1 TaxID=1889001 RepID=A0A1J5TGZ0_9ARCH|nr:MAG: peroxiredoxin [Marine Group III euryarchaeote CG-Bathy1]